MAIKMKINDPVKAQKYFNDKMEFTTGPAELQHFMDHDAILNIIDVRDQVDYDQGHIPGAKSLPQDKWNMFEDLRRDCVNVIYCYSQVCHLAANAARKFAGQGFPVMELEDGFKGWKEQENEIETSQIRNHLAQEKPVKQSELL